MSVNFKTPALLLALLTAMALCWGGTVSALANTGGAAAAPSTPTSPPPAKARPSGIATWFGPGFYGKQTACGQTLTPAVVGVANRTLPCGTLVSVTYDGHSLTVPVLDRGPYSHRAEWDLTAGAAQSLGITETVRIATHIVGKTTNTPSLGLPPVSPSAALAGGAVAG
ncbi:MAG TPA: septal ring lytic transglycosylase RlpA family protein [Solirubrobacteraceae bacterium]|jgi:rare lipoprotein A (peptidoglycan hydrolase)|nr:septal ring lytic transglycosylase RlpA family protein [Solirubrobacteraceae bacterium]